MTKRVKIYNKYKNVYIFFRYFHETFNLTLTLFILVYTSKRARIQLNLNLRLCNVKTFFQTQTGINEIF